MTVSNSKNYRELSAELETILDQLQSGSLDVDDALKTFERGQAVVKLLQAKLQQAENKIKKLPTK